MEFTYYIGKQVRAVTYAGQTYNGYLTDIEAVEGIDMLQIMRGGKRSSIPADRVDSIAEQGGRENE